MASNTNELINQYQEQEQQVLEQTAYDYVDNFGKKDADCCIDLCCDGCCAYLCCGC